MGDERGECLRGGEVGLFCSFRGSYDPLRGFLCEMEDTIWRISRLSFLAVFAEMDFICSYFLVVR